MIIKSSCVRIWVDADACPKVIKEILYRAADRTQTITFFVANQPLILPLSPFVKKIQVPAGFNVADNYIVQHMAPKDLVITADIPLADAIIDKEGFALNSRGEWYSKDNIKQRLSIRNFSEELRNSGIRTSGPDRLSKKEIRTFANFLDQFLAMAQKNY